MPYSLKGRNVLVTGGSRGLGALICEKFADEGANIMVNYVSAADKAKEVAAKAEAKGVKSFVIQADAGVPEDNVRMVKETVDKLGGLDIIIANAGWTRFSEFGDLDAFSVEEWNKCWATNVMHHLQLMQVARPIFDANPEGGVYLITSSVAVSCSMVNTNKLTFQAISCGGSSMAYSVTKAAGVHLMKCIATTQGEKLRINAILPGLLLTEWGLKYSEEKQIKIKNDAPLKREVRRFLKARALLTTPRRISMTAPTCILRRQRTRP